jgi:hypothetical protein
VVVVGFAIFAFLLLHATSELGANLLFSDQWGIYPALDAQPWWQGFFLQQGPHRLGLGGIATALIAGWTDWDARAEGLFSAVMLVVAAGLALAIKVRLTGRWSVFDLAIPALFLALTQYEWLVIAPYPAAAVVPLVLLLAFALTLTVRDPVIRYPSAVVLGVACAYTGYGLVFAPLLPLALLLGARAQNQSGRASLAAAAILLALQATALLGFRWDGAGCSSVSSWGTWLQFVATLYGRPASYAFGDPRVWPLFGLLSGATVALSVGAAARDSRAHPALVPLALLASASLFYALATATGRLCLGTNAANAGRYVTLMTPVFFALYVGLWFLPWRRLRPFAVGLASAAMIFMVVTAGRNDLEAARPIGLLKQAYAECYLRMQSVARCDQWVSYPMSGLVGSDAQFQELSRRGLSLFSPRFAAEPRLIPPDFDADLYLRANPDVAAAGMGAVHHYVTHGRDEGRRLRP